MATTRTTAKKPRASLDRSIQRLRKQLADLAPYLGKGKPTRSLEEFDLETEHVIADLLGETSELLEAYEYAELGEAAGLVNMPEEAPEGRGMDGERQRLLQRSRVLESCVSELEARQSAEPKKRRNAHRSTGEPNTSLEVRSLNQDVSLREAGQHMQKWKGTHDEGTGHPAFSCDARWSHHRSHFGIEYSAVLLRRGLATG
jgi:hypothetical protein